MNKILSQYQQQIDAQILAVDDAQQRAVEELARLAQELEQRSSSQCFWRRPKVTTGVYLYGPVGRGKSMLMDLFFQHLNSDKKQRLHFHHFMAFVHQRLGQLQGVKNPMRQLAKEYARSTDVLCFDEFFVSDIGDAMIMARLFEALFAQGMVLVATSNCHPQQLYRNGLQRARFEPTIALLEAHCHVCDVSGEQDYRLQGFAGFRYYIAYGPEVLSELFKQQQRCSIKPCIREINRRSMHFMAYASDAAMIDFFALCGDGRASADYMELAQQLQVLYVDKVPAMGVAMHSAHVAQGTEDGYIRDQAPQRQAQYDDEARRFIALVDEFYDNHKLLIITAEVELESLYQGERLAFEFARTQSRLIEMQRWSLPSH
ncbi:ATPase, AFG1 family [Pseudoalteromonas sp. SW0106-04]|uniref:cell division protein ZapE n=1 Tax=Pseudoalteromonas sp. SW0106-04 TaxID=1702169 RepID=UPI0006B4C7EC|nr:cell division protein ZapE [Pseudoalteromonas sp. SW0106-04]GAP74562.1 ATPase, AFG1 family [Pseudoalteromonas sp. SW0106-04]